MDVNDVNNSVTECGCFVFCFDGAGYDIEQRMTFWTFHCKLKHPEDIYIYILYTSWSRLIDFLKYCTNTVSLIDFWHIAVPFVPGGL